MARIVTDTGVPRVERVTFQATTDSAQDVTVKANPRNENPVEVVLGGGAPEMISGVSGSAFMLAAAVYLIDIHIDPASVGSHNGKIIFEIRAAADDTILAVSTSPTLSRADDPVGIKAALILPEAKLVHVAYLRRNAAITLQANWTVEFIRLGRAIG